MTGDYFSACDGKKEFPTYWKAKREASKLNRRDDSAKANPYKCAGTHHFHIGNTRRMKHKQTSRHNMKGYLGHGRTKIPKYSR